MNHIRRLTLCVTGITCSNCSTGIEFALRGVAGIISATVNRATDDLEVVYNSDMISTREVVRRIRKTGFDIATSKVETGITGMRDDTDALNLENLLLSQEGVISAGASYTAGTALFEFIPGTVSLHVITRLIKNAGFEVLSTQNDLLTASNNSLNSNKKTSNHISRMIAGLVLAIPLVVFSMLRDFGIAGFAYDLWAMFAVATVVQFYSGSDFYTGAWRSLRLGRANMDVLIVLGSSIAWLSSALVVLGLIPGRGVFFETGAVIIAFIRLGKYLEASARGKTSEAIQSLMALQVPVARVVTGNDEKEVPVEELKFGDKIIIRPGERVPVDGVICSGSTAIDESTVTGESMPVTKGPGTVILGGTMNLSGSVVFEATKVGSESTLAQMARLVREAQMSKPPIQELTDEVGKYFVPLIMALAFFTFVGWVYVGAVSWEDAMINAIAVLVIACPCAIGLATPTAIVVGLARGAGLGILFRTGEALENTGKAEIIVLDKTGTITTGKPEITDLIPLGDMSSDELLALAASAETGSEHPVGRAIAGEGKRKGLTVTQAKDFKVYSGYGISAAVDKRVVIVGSPAMFLKLGIDHGGLSDGIKELQSMGKTVALVATAPFDDRKNITPVGIITVADAIKPGASRAIEELKKLGAEVVMITGDNPITANAVAAEVGITRVIAGVPPGGKVDAIRRLQQTGAKSGIAPRIVAMVGDGINDAPALAAADAGIAIGSGSDIAVAAADVTLPGGDLSAVAKAISLSRGTSETIVQNLIWALFYNVSLIPVAAFGLLSPMFAAGAMVLSSIFVVVNSLKLKEYKIRAFQPPKSLIRKTFELVPRLAVPTISLMALITLPMLAMSKSEMEIKNTLQTGMAPLLMMVMAISNGLIAISYSSIPVFLAVFIRKRKDLPFSWILVLFGLFILACGATHVVHIIGLWWAVDWWQASIDASCAVISIGTAIVLWPYLPKLLAIPSQTQLKMINAELQAEQEKLLRTQNELKKAYELIEKKVEERTAELVMTNRALQMEIHEREKAENEVRLLNIELEKRVKERTVQYEEANQELESFSYSVSHDLRAPLRGIDGFSLALLEDYHDTIDERGQMYLDRVRFNAQKMGLLIDEMLKLSRVSRAQMSFSEVNLSEIAETVMSELQETGPDRRVNVTIEPGLTVKADSVLMGAVLQNLLSNAWKFTSKKEKGEIIFGHESNDGEIVYFVRDNGAGFNMEYADKLFAPFQRLHRNDEFSGTGVGLTTVQRIIKRHSGRIWAEGEVGEGATFYFTIHSEKGE